MLVSFLHFHARGLYCALNFLSSPAPAKGAPSTRFEISSSSAAVPNPVSEATTFFAHFEQVVTNDLDLADF